MKMLKIIQAPDERLKKKAQKVEKFDSTLKNFALDMFYTMVKKDGCGLAAIQIEDDVRFSELKTYDDFRPQPNLILIKPEIEENFTVAVNPEIIYTSSETCLDSEKCLSLPGKNNAAQIERYVKIKVRYQNLSGEFNEKELSDFEARIWQHEIDHNNGIIYPDRLTANQNIMFWLKYKTGSKV